VSRSPAPRAPAGLEDYETGWVVLHRMLREGGSLSGRERHCVYLNCAGGEFTDVSAISGLNLPDDGRAAARVDWDLDGRTDLVLTSRSGPRVRVMRNGYAAADDWVQLGLEQPGANRDAIGSRVEIALADGSRSVESLRAGEGFLAQSSKWLHFGLGPRAEIAAVTVRWPDGERERFDGVVPRHRLLLRRGEGRAVDVPRAAAALAASTPEPEPATERARIPLAAPLPLPALGLSTVDGTPAGVDLTQLAKSEGPVLLLVWASWCAPCLAELQGLVDEAAELRGGELTVIALCADDPDRRAAADAHLDRIAWPFGRAFAGPRELEVLDCLQEAALDRRRRLPLPAAFLLDRAGDVSVIYKGPVSAAVLVADAATVDGDPEALRDRAVPFPGRWRSAPPSADLGRLEARFEGRGLTLAARDVGLRRIVTTESSRAEVLDGFGLAHARAGDFESAIANFQEAVALDPDGFAAWYHLGTALHRAGRLEAAIAAYERALDLDARSTEVLFNLALAYHVAGDTEGAWQRQALLAAIAPESGAELAEQLRGLEAR